MVLAVVLGEGSAAAQDARALFLQHCASCHGETGDGRGTTVLDRPARSFKEGGFSHGNTTEALVRTITFGIPGSPMPASPSVLTEADRNALAHYVLSLGPTIEAVSAAESVLRVADRPAIVRGKLPAMAEGLPEHARGLLVGLPDGSSFEYRIDDVRLLGFRQGDFVDRADWRGRGGNALEPLGSLLWVCGNGNPGPTFLRGDTGEALAARLVSTTLEREGPRLTYELGPPGGEGPAAIVAEAPGARASLVGPGFVRRLTIETGIPLRLRVAGPGPALFACGMHWTVRRQEDGGFEAISLGGLGPDELLLPVDGGAEVRLRPGPSHAREIEVSVALAREWSDEIEARWRAGIAR